MNEFADWIGRETAMSEVSSSTAEQYAIELGKKGLAPATFNQKIDYLSFIWKTLSSSFKSFSNPWSEIPKKKVDSVARDTLTDDEIARAVELSRNDYGGDVSLGIIIGANTGLRLGDVANLKWNNIDFEAGAIRVKTRKTGVNVTIPLFDELRAELKARKETIEDNTGDCTAAKNKFIEKTTRIAPGYEDYVIPRIAERYNRRSSFASSLMTIAFQKAGIQTSVKTGVGMARPLHGFHSLRATFITRCGVLGIPHQIIMAVVGHATPEMTQHYTHAKEKEVLEAFSKLNI